MYTQILSLSIQRYMNVNIGTTSESCVSPVRPVTPIYTYTFSVISLDIYINIYLGTTNEGIPPVNPIYFAPPSMPLKCPKMVSTYIYINVLFFSPAFTIYIFIYIHIFRSTFHASKMP